MAVFDNAINITPLTVFWYYIIQIINVWIPPCIDILVAIEAPTIEERWACNWLIRILIIELPLTNALPIFVVRALFWVLILFLFTFSASFLAIAIAFSASFLAIASARLILFNPAGVRLPSLFWYLLIPHLWPRIPWW